jgi:MarR family transcriptional regulator, lower aerobic nicotinate degradation pathway regulator
VGQRTATSPSAKAGSPPGYALLIFRLARATGYRLGAALAGLGMRTHEFAVLHHLHDAGPLSQQQLGGALRINPSNLVGLLDALQADGLVVRPRDPADRRRHLVGLTPAGERRLTHAKRAAATAEQDLLSPLSDEEREQFRHLLERLATHVCAAPGSRGRSC